MLTYSIMYTPALSEEKAVKYTCWDNKIHIRFKDYKKAQVVEGFEAKLAYLLSYLINFSYLPNILEVKNEKILIEDFLSTDDAKTILATIESYMSNYNFKFNGIKLSKNYNRQNELKYFGKAFLECFPFNRNKEIAYKACLKEFLLNLGKISLFDYLFNDGYKIIIHEAKERKINKFERKQLKLDNMIAESESGLIELW